MSADLLLLSLLCGGALGGKEKAKWRERGRERERKGGKFLFFFFFSEWRVALRVGHAGVTHPFYIHI